MLALAVPALIVFSLFVQMSEGATFAIVPYLNKRAMGAVAGIVGAGGNFGAMLAGFLFRREADFYGQSYLILGILVAVCAFMAFMVRFSESEERAAAAETATRLAASSDSVPAGAH